MNYTNKKLYLTFFIGTFLILGLGMQPAPARAAGGTLTNFSYSAGSYAANATTTYTFTYTTATNVPSGNFILYVLFPYQSTPGYAATYSWTQSQIASNVTVTVNGVPQTIVSGSSYVAGASGLLGVALNTAVSGGSNVVVTVQNIHNNATSGTYTWDPSLSSSFIKTANGGGGTIDGPSSISALVLTPALDTTPPVVVFTSPAASSTVAGTGVTLSASATDNVAVGGVTFYVDGTKIGSEITSGSGSTYSQTWDSTATTSGTHTAFAVARDTSNNYATTSPVTFSVDNTAPVISNATSTIGVNNTSATLTWTTDKLTSSRVYFGPTSSFSTSTPITDTSPYVTNHSVTIPGLLACTTYLYEIIDADVLGNTATSSIANMTTAGCAGTANVVDLTSGSLTSSIGATKTLTNGSHILSVVYPAGVTASSTSLGSQIKELDGLGTIPMPSGSLSLVPNSVYDLEALIDATTTLTSFATPVTVTLYFTPSDIAGLVESSLTMYHYHNGTWIQLTGCSLNTTADSMTCTTPSFSTFALFGTEDVPISTSGTGGSSSGGIVYGCTDPHATNYTEFAANNPALCVYAAGSASLPFTPGGPMIPATSATSSAVSSSSFTRNLKRGMSGSDVTALQQFLIAANTGPSAKALAAVGASGYFGSATKAALIEYQKAHAILPAAGYFGPITRASL